MMTSHHTTECRAYAVGCAVENIRDAEDRTSAKDADPITEGASYLADGTVSCHCAQDMSPLYLSATLTRGYAALVAAVAALHALDARGNCAECGEDVNGYGTPWPCSTAQIVTGARAERTGA